MFKYECYTIIATTVWEKNKSLTAIHMANNKVRFIYCLITHLQCYVYIITVLVVLFGMSWRNI